MCVVCVCISINVFMYFEYTPFNNFWHLMFNVCQINFQVFCFTELYGFSCVIAIIGVVVVVVVVDGYLAPILFGGYLMVTLSALHFYAENVCSFGLFIWLLSIFSNWIWFVALKFMIMLGVVHFWCLFVCCISLSGWIYLKYCKNFMKVK